MNEDPGKKRSLNHVFTNGEMFLLGLGVAVIGNVLFQVVGGFLLSAVAVLGDLMVLMSVGRWIYERLDRVKDLRACLAMVCVTAEPTLQFMSTN